jgi:hypothetical protein
VLCSTAICVSSQGQVPKHLEVGQEPPSLTSQPKPDKG